MPALYAENLCLSYGKSSILNGVDLMVETGEIVCIWGPSGEGKTSLLRVLGGLEKATGVVSFFDESVKMDYPSALDKARRRVGFIFQSCALISNMSVWKNVELPLLYHGIEPSGGLELHVETALKNMLVEEYRDVFPHELSLGLQKRVAVARALVMDPDFLLMDEPTSGLDHLSRLNLLGLIQNMSQLRRTSAVIVTHDLQIPSELKAKVAILSGGVLSKPVRVDELHTLDIEFVRDILDELRSQKKYESFYEIFIKRLESSGVDSKLLTRSEEYARAEVLRKEESSVGENIDDFD